MKIWTGKDKNEERHTVDSGNSIVVRLRGDESLQGSNKRGGGTRFETPSKEQRGKRTRGGGQTLRLKVRGRRTSTKLYQRNEQKNV